MTGPDFQARTRILAKDSANIAVTTHARERMVERGITDQDVQQALLRGSIVDGPFINAHGNWQATLGRQLAGQEVQVVVALERQDVIVISVF